MREAKPSQSAIPALIHTARPDGCIDYFNEAWLEYLGVTLDEVIGLKWTISFIPMTLTPLWRTAGRAREWQTL